MYEGDLAALSSGVPAGLENTTLIPVRGTVRRRGVSGVFGSAQQGTPPPALHPSAGDTETKKSIRKNVTFVREDFIILRTAAKIPREMEILEITAERGRDQNPSIQNLPD